jgi:D-alanyl-D-alanine carboxypeptidase (penicillin-binding protein 5/6)
MVFSDKPALIVASLASIALGGAFFFALLMLFIHPFSTPAKQAVFPPAITLAPQALAAQAAILYDPTDGRVLFQKNADFSLPLASLTKIMTAETVLAASGGNNPKITITPADTALEADAGDWGFRAGDVVALSDLIKIGLVASSNEAMAAAAGSLGSNYLDQMNKTAGSLGLSHTYFLNPTGLDLNVETSGAYGSAYDVARLTAAFYETYPQYFTLTQQSIVSIPASGRTLSVAATTVPLQNIPGFMAAKTGYTDLAGGNLVAVFDIEVGHPLIAVALGSTETGRFDDVRTLINAVRQASATTL